MSQTIAEREIQQRDRLRIEQSQWLTLWRQCAEFCCPHKQRVVQNAWAALPVEARPRFNPMRQCSTAIDALNVASGGLKSWLIPDGDEGFGCQLQPDPSREDSTEVKDWFADCTERMLYPAKRGGFFTSSHEMIQDLLWAGTGGMLMDDGDEDIPIACKAIEASNFVGQRDWRDEVIRVIITWNKSATEIRNQFNQPGDNVPPAVIADCEGNNGDNRHEFIQSLYLRGIDERNEARVNEPAGQPIASCWIHVTSKMLMRERGYPEMPFVAPRWNTWAGTGTSFYGTSPAMQALADMKGLNLFDMIMATRAELEINPRVKVMPSQSGAIDLSPGGITQMAERDGVTEWAMAGNYPIGKDQCDIISRRIERAFFKDLFEAITPIAQQREMNIPVAEAVQREAAARITPAMSRFEQDFFDQAMLRLFMVHYRAGKFAPPPADAFHQDKAGRFYLILPRVAQANRMSRTMNARKSFAFSQSMSRALTIAQVYPAVFKMYDFDTIQRDLDRGDGMPKEWTLTKDAIKKIEEAELAAQQQLMVQQTAATAMANHPLDMAKIASGQIAA